MKDAQEIFTGMIGDWKGICRTWFQPGKLADESEITGTIRRGGGDAFLRHEYSGEIQGKLRHGDETILFHVAKGLVEVAWIDTFHMSEAIMHSTGTVGGNGFTVRGSYEAGPGNPPWGWKTVFEIIDTGHLKISAFNITPDGQEAKAVEIDYDRVK